MNGPDGLVLGLPVSPDMPLHWWRMANGAVSQSGTLAALHDVDDSEALTHIVTDTDGTHRIMALVPSAETAIHFFEWPDLTPAQAMTAATLKASETVMGARDDTHVATAVLLPHDGAPVIAIETVSAAIGAQYLSRWLDELRLAGVDPDIVTPAGLVLPRPENGIVRARIGDDTVLRTPDAVFADDPSLREILVADRPVKDVSPQKADQLIARAFAHPPLNLRQGVFVKKREGGLLTRAQIRRLSQMTLAVAVLTVLIFVVDIAKYSISADAARDQALTEAQARFPAATDMAGAEQMADEALRQRGLGTRLFTVPASALFAALEPLPSVSVRQLSYQTDGTISVTLAAARKEDIDTALIALQRQGYAVTVPPSLSQDATGSVIAAITVRVA